MRRMTPPADRERRTAHFDELRQDARHSIRQLAASPAFTVTAVLTLALGIGATAAIFGAVDTVVLRPFAWAHPDRVVAPVEWWHDLAGSVSAGNYIDWRDQATGFDALAAEQYSPINLSEGQTPERVMAGRVTSNFFAVFGVRPILGRTFRPDEDQPGQDQVAILSEALWTRRFGRDSTILNRTTRMNGMPVTVVGVMPRSFDPTASGEELWTPLALTPAQKLQHDDHSFFVVGLLSPRTTLARARTEMDQIGRRLAERFPQEDSDRGVHVIPLADLIIGAERPRLLAVLGAVFRAPHRLWQCRQSPSRAWRGASQGNRHSGRARRRTQANHSSTADRESGARRIGSGVRHRIRLDRDQGVRGERARRRLSQTRGDRSMAGCLYLPWPWQLPVR